MYNELQQNNRTGYYRLMYVRDAVAAFGSRAALYHALDKYLSRGAVYQWPEDGLVPLDKAVLLAEAGRAMSPPVRIRVNFAAYRREARRMRAEANKRTEGV